jgi:hypothetical protein
MNTKGNLALALLAGISIRGRERHGGSRAGGQNAARLSDRGNRRNRPRRLSEVRREGSGNAGPRPEKAAPAFRTVMEQPSIRAFVGCSR